MNRIYKVIWSKTRNCYVAVSELAKNHGKDNVRSEKRGIVKGASSLALCIALSLGVTGSAWADETITGNLTVTGDTIKVGTDGTITVDANHNSIFGESNTLENRLNSTNKNQYDTLLGNSNYIYYGNYTTAIGYRNRIGSTSYPSVYSNYSTAIGYSNSVTGSYQTAIGNSNNIYNASSNNYGSNNSTAIGSSNTVYGGQNIAIGSDNDIRGKDNVNTNNNVAIGQYAHIIGDSNGSNIAIGSSAYITDYYLSNGSPTTTTSFGDSYWSVQSPIRDSIAMGASSYALSSRVTAVGNFTRVVGPNSSAFGYGAQIYGQRNNTAIGNYSLAGFPYAKKYDDQTGRYVKDSLYGADNTAVGSYSMAGSGYNNVAIGARSRAGYWSQVSYDERMAALQASAMEQYGDYDGYMNEVQRRAGEIIDAQINGNPPEGYDEWSEEQKDSYRNWQMNQYLYSSPSHVNMYDGNTAEDTGGSRIINDILFEQWLKMKNNNQIQSDDYSTAVGVEASAEGVGQTAIGGHAQALGWSSMAVGLGSKSTGASSMAIGESSLASGDASMAIGNTSESRGYKTLAIGPQTKAFGDESIAIGLGNYDNTQTWGYRATAIGINAHADTSSAIAIGDGAKIDYDGAGADILQRRIAMNAIAVGQNARAAALDGTAVGRNTKAIMRNATAYGNNAHANAWNSIAIGNKAIAGKAERIYLEKKNEKGDVIGYEVLPTVKVTDDDGLKYVTQGAEFGDSAVAIGNRAKAIKEYTTAVGAGTNAEGWHAVAVGDSNQATGKFSTAIGAGWSENYTPGEENDDGSSADKDSINTEGDRIYTAMGANQAGGDYSTAVGYMNQTVGTQSTALGKDNAISGLSSLGIGAGNEVGAVDKGDNGVLSADQENTVSGYAVGSYNKITGTEDSNAGAFGANNTVAGENGYAVGNSNAINEGAVTSFVAGNNNIIDADAANSFVVANNVKATKEQTVVVGHHNISDKEQVFGKNSISIGTDAQASELSAVAVGANATVTETTIGGVALGSDSVADRRAGWRGENPLGVPTKDDEGHSILGTPAWTSTASAVSVGGGTVAKTNKNGEYIDVSGQVVETADKAAQVIATRQITNVAAGTEDTDAVNMAQLKGFAAHYYSVNTDPTEEGDTPEAPDSNFNNDGAIGAEAIAAGFYSTAIGKESSALGNKTLATGRKSVASGYKSTAAGEESISLGHEAVSGALVKFSTTGEGTDIHYASEIIKGGEHNEYIFLPGETDGNKIVVAYNTNPEHLGYYKANPDGNGGYVADPDTVLDKNEVEKVLNMGGISIGSYAHAEGNRSLAVGRATGAYDKNSAAMGIASMAMGHGGLAIGHNASAGALVDTELEDDGTYSAHVILENGSPVASGGVGGITIGSFAHALGNKAISVGRASGAYDEDSMALGLYANAYGKGSQAIGHNATVGAQVKIEHDETTDTYTTTLIRDDKGESMKRTNVSGEVAKEGDDLSFGGVAIGSYSHTAGNRALAVGRASGAYGENSTAMGIYSNAMGQGSIALGHGTSTGVKAEIVPSGEEGTAEYADGLWTTKLDTDSTGNPISNGNDGGIAIGSYAHTEGTRAMAIGRVSGAYGTNSTVVGLHSNAYGEGSMAFGHGVTAGDKDTPYASQIKDLHNNPNLSYDLDGNDDYGINPDNVVGAVAIGSYAEATARGTLSVGRYSKAQSAYSTAMGIRAEVAKGAKNGIAIGREVTVGTDDGGENSVAIGKQSTVTGSNSIAIGTGHVVVGNKSGAFGDPNKVNGDSSYILGNNSEIGTITSSGTTGGETNADIAVNNAFIIGNDSKIADKDAEGGLVFGSGAQVSKENGVALGNNTNVTLADSVALGSDALAGEKRGYEKPADNDVVVGNLTYSSSRFAGTGGEVIGTVSVGDEGKVRTITNVAAGRITADSTDAINGSQLYAAYDQLPWKVGIGKDGGTNGKDDAGALEQSVVWKQDEKNDRSNVKFIAGKGIDISKADIENGYGVKVSSKFESATVEDGKITQITYDGDTYDIASEDTDTTYSYTDTTENAKKDDASVVQQITVTENKPDGTTEEVAKFTDTDTHNGLKNDENQVTYVDGEGSVTITDQDGNTTKITGIKLGTDTDTHNGLKNDENTVVYNENGEGSVTITDQDGNTTTINNIVNTT
ncbi:Head domain of trimeric autotransporter adhesin, partial [Succiniclasticum ruminis DSM 9236]